MTKAVPALRYHGAKFRLAKWIIPMLPPHAVYVEPYGGAAGVLLQKPRSYCEVYNDLDGDIVNYFRVLRDPDLRERLIEAVIMTPYAREEFDLATKPCDDMVEKARRLAIRAQMGFGSAGASKGTTGFRIDTRPKYGTAQGLWARFPENIVQAADRFSGVLIENRPALDVMRQHDAADTLHFVDPPYVHSSRKMDTNQRRYYSHEMDDAAHAELLAFLGELEGMVIVCGYPSDLYTDALSTWQFHTTKSRISAGRGTALRDECCWINRAAVQASSRSGYGLFEQGVTK